MKFKTYHRAVLAMLSFMLVIIAAIVMWRVHCSPIWPTGATHLAPFSF